MKVNTFCKIGITAGAAALLVGALAIPAQADPTAGTFGTLVGVGSDTTQGVVNGLATAIGGGKLASYDAITPAGGSASVVTRSGGTAIPRVSGSGAGRDELLVAIGALASKSSIALSDGTTTTITSSVVDQIDFARSSGGPGTAADPSGVLAYVPFARDAVDVAVDTAGPLSVVPFFVGSAASDSHTQPSLYNIYRGNVTYAYVSGAAGSWVYQAVGDSATVPVGSASGTKAYKIQPVLPKFGSGTRSYFLTQLGFTAPNADAADWATSAAHAGYGVKDTYLKNAVATPIEEHDGTAIADSTNGIADANTYAVGPFSIGQYVAQSNGIIANRHDGVSLTKLGGTAVPTTNTDYTAPTTGTAPALKTNGSFTTAMIRDVYNIVPSRKLDDPSSNIAKMFSGPNSLVCLQPDVITTYGFLLETGTNNSITACGSTNTALRAYPVSASTTTVTADASVVVGGSITATAGVVSNGNGGGTVQFQTTGNKVLASATIPTGSTSVSVSIPASAVGSVPVHAQFIPRLDGVASSSSGDATVSVTGTTTTITTTKVATATSTAITVPKLTVNKSAAVAVSITGGTFAGGTVTLRDGATVLGTAGVAFGASTAVVNFVPSKLSYSLSASYAPADGTVLASSSAVAAAKAVKGAATIKVAKVKIVKVGTKSKLAITVSGIVKPTGTVTIKQGSKTLVSKAKLVKGKVTVKIAKLAKGTHKVTITYNGNTIYKAVKKADSFKVKA